MMRRRRRRITEEAAAAKGRRGRKKDDAAVELWPGTAVVCVYILFSRLVYVYLCNYLYIPNVAPLIGRAVLFQRPVGFHDGAIARSRADYISVPFGIER